MQPARVAAERRMGFTPKKAATASRSSVEISGQVGGCKLHHGHRILREQSTLNPDTDRGSIGCWMELVNTDVEKPPSHVSPGR